MYFENIKYFDWVEQLSSFNNINKCVSKLYKSKQIKELNPQVDPYFVFSTTARNIVFRLTPKLKVSPDKKKIGNRSSSA